MRLSVVFATSQQNLSVLAKINEGAAARSRHFTAYGLTGYNNTNTIQITTSFGKMPKISLK